VAIPKLYGYQHMTVMRSPGALLIEDFTHEGIVNKADGFNLEQVHFLILNFKKHF
jgi:hypothetical protein